MLSNRHTDPTTVPSLRMRAEGNEQCFVTKLSDLPFPSTNNMACIYLLLKALGSAVHVCVQITIFNRLC